MYLKAGWKSDHPDCIEYCHQAPALAGWDKDLIKIKDDCGGVVE